MMTDEATVMNVAAVLAAAQYTMGMTAALSGVGPRSKDSSVDVLINILREMEQKKLIRPGFAPTPVPPIAAPAVNARANRQMASRPTLVPA